MRAVAIVVVSLVVLAAAFLFVPRLLLHLSGKTTASATPPALVATAAVAATPSDPIEGFASLASKAGFTPLSPGVLPSGYTLAGQYVASGRQPEIIFAYRNGTGRYLVIAERQGRQETFFPPPGNQRPIEIATPLPNAPHSVQIGESVRGLYQPNDYRLMDCYQGDPIRKYTCHDEPPTSLRFMTRGVAVVIAADGRDLDVETLIRVAAGLR